MGVIQDLRVAAPTLKVPRICLLIGTLGLGGAEKQLVLLAKGLHERGVPVHVVTLFETGPREEVLAASGIPVTNLSVGGLRATPAGAMRAVRAVWRLAGFLRRERPEVLHAFLFMSYVLAAMATLFTRVPVLIAGRRSMGDFKNGYPLARPLERFANRRTRLLIANAAAVAKDTCTRERVPASKVTVVYNGLPESAFAPPEPADLDCDGLVLVCVANLHVYKGHRFLLDALALLRDRGYPLTTVLIGAGPCLDTLKAQAAALDLDVRMIGLSTDVAGYLARADLAVLPSLTEGMSNAVMEAMAAGLPIVATGVGGTTELLAGRGVLVPPSDAGALADALELLLTRPDYAAEIAYNAREFARTELTAAVMAERYLSIYRDEVNR